MNATTKQNIINTQNRMYQAFLKNSKQPKTRYVAFNQITRKWEVVNIEDETVGSKVIEQIWSASLEKWVTIPTE